MAKTILDSACDHLHSLPASYRDTPFERRTATVWEVRRLCARCAADPDRVQRLVQLGFRPLDEESTNTEPEA